MKNERQVQPTRYGQYAGFVTRLVAWIIDQIIVGAILFVLFWIADFVTSTININKVLGLLQWTGIVAAIVGFLVVIGVAFVYNVGFWSLAGQTPGKRIMGIRIVRSNGQRLTIWAATVRWLGYLLSAILFLGFLWVLVDNQRQALHDKLARTLVIYSWPEPEDLEGPQSLRDRLRHRQQQQEARERGTWMPS